MTDVKAVADRIESESAFLRDVLQEVGRQRGGVVANLSLLTIVNSAWVVAADPLTPAMQVEGGVALGARKIGVTDEPQVRLEIERRECLREAHHSGGETTGARVSVGTLKG